jgi:hypothetical protein
LNRAGERTRAPSHDLAPTTTDFSGIYIRAHPGTTTRRDVEEARARAAEQEAGRGKRVTFGDVEDAMIDGRASWGWLEEERDDRGLQYVEYRAVIPYDTITYTVEFATGDPSWKVKPDSMRVAVLSFAYGQTVWNKGLITLLLVGTVLGVGLLIRRGKSRLYTQTQDMTLVKFRDSGEGARGGDGRRGRCGPFTRTRIEARCRPRAPRTTASGPRISLVTGSRRPFRVFRGP